MWIISCIDGMDRLGMGRVNLSERVSYPESLGTFRT